MDTDRMGGFIAGRIVPVSDIDIFLITADRVSITLKSGKSFFEIISQKNGISANVTPNSSRAGIIFTINIDFDAKNPTGLKIASFNKFIAVLTKPDGSAIVFGTPAYPLTALKSPILSNTPAGKEGESITLTGKQPVYPYFLAE